MIPSSNEIWGVMVSSFEDSDQIGRNAQVDQIRRWMHKSFFSHTFISTNFDEKKKTRNRCLVPS